ncbi:MAG TPA: hypothetical protein VEC96_05090 [Anaerolineae bacterium]|nr:hypothetical protein [Anaerolineae bacterium]
MAILSDAERKELWAEFMQLNNESIGITKTDLRAALNAIDSWVDNNTASFNTAIPQPARSALSARQKAWLLMLVVERRFEVS